MSDLSNRSSLLSELEESQSEVRRLRALLIAKDAELGEAKGRAVELEASSLRLAHMLNFARALVARALRAARAGLRGIRG